jgi:hypothetical protein
MAEERERENAGQDRETRREALEKRWPLGDGAHDIILLATRWDSVVCFFHRASNGMVARG